VDAHAHDTNMLVDNNVIEIVVATVTAGILEDIHTPIRKRASIALPLLSLVVQSLNTEGTQDSLSFPVVSTANDVPGIVFTLWGRVPSESLSSSDSSVSSSSYSLSTSPFIRFKPSCRNLSTPVSMFGSSGIMMFLACLIVRQSTFFFSTTSAHTIRQM
jgi:hypothetical protein